MHHFILLLGHTLSQAVLPDSPYPLPQQRPSMPDLHRPHESFHFVGCNFCQISNELVCLESKDNQQYGLMQESYFLSASSSNRRPWKQSVIFLHIKIYTCIRARLNRSARRVNSASLRCHAASSFLLRMYYLYFSCLMRRCSAYNYRSASIR